jgi:ankyrin repeat protein
MKRTERRCARRTLVALLVGVVVTTAFHVDASSAALAALAQLIDAAKKSDSGAIEALLEQGVAADATEPDGTTALHWASYRDDLDSAGLLIRAGAPVNAANDLGATALWTASQNGSTTMVTLLLNAGADPNVALLNGETPAMVAARSGSAAVIAMLAEGGADLDARSTRDQTALMWAAAQSHADVVSVLVDYGADVHARSAVWSQLMAVPPHSYSSNHRYVPHGANTALMFAARAGAVESVQRLVAAGADVTDSNAWGVSAVAMAAHAGHTDVAELLLEHDADPDAANAGFAPLHAAVMHRNERLVASLLAHGADPNVQLGAWTPRRRASADHNFEPALVGATPFWLAARFAEAGLMRILASHGANPLFTLDVEYQADYRDGVAKHQRDVTTAVMAATGMGGNTQRAWIQRARVEPERAVLDAVRLATELGASVDGADQTGDTPLHYAAVNGHDLVVTYLVEQGARLDVENDRGETPRRAAAARGRGGFTVELLDSLAELR